MTDDDSEWTLTFESITPREYITLVSALSQIHEKAHWAEMNGETVQDDLDAIHNLMEEADDAPEGLVDAADEFAEELVEEATPDTDDIDKPEALESLEEELKEATGADEVVAIPAEALEEGGNGGDDDPMFH